MGERREEFCSKGVNREGRRRRQKQEAQTGQNKKAKKKYLIGIKCPDSVRG